MYVFVVDGNWRSWYPWSACDATCGKGNKIRARSCTDPKPLNGGAFCEGEPAEEKECDQGPCPGEFLQIII